jgi:hypothetical protein
MPNVLPKPTAAPNTAGDVDEFRRISVNVSDIILGKLRKMNIHEREKMGNLVMTRTRSQAQVLSGPLIANKFIHGAATAAQLVISGNFVTMVQNRRREEGSRVMYRRPLPRPWLDWSPRRLNTLAQGLHAQRYLEIGIFRGVTAERINVCDRVGVDPAPKFDQRRLPTGFSIFAVESDRYFASLAAEVNFDLAFIDGLHTFEQTKTDLFNTLRHVRSGVILIDDTVPLDEDAALPDLDETIARRLETGSKQKAWMGDVWKLVFFIDRYLPQLDFRTIVGSGNEQTLVWRRRYGEEIPEPSGAEFEVRSYRETFANGVPDQFRPSTEVEAIQACLAAIRLQR